MYLHSSLTCQTTLKHTIVIITYIFTHRLVEAQSDGGESVQPGDPCIIRDVQMDSHHYANGCSSL